MFFGFQKVFSKMYHSPGIYSETLSVPHQRTSGTLEIRMINEHQQAYFDSHTFTFNQHFYKLFKWFLILPFLIMAFVLIFQKELLPPLLILI